MLQDVYRIKGVLSLAGSPSLYVFQGVCGELKGQAARAWRADEIRRSELVIIGKDWTRTHCGRRLISVSVGETSRRYESSNQFSICI